MAQFSAFAPFGLFDFSADPSPAEALYESMVSQLGAAFEMREGSYKEAMVYATAIAVACARATVRRAANQRHPSTAYDKIPTLERDYGITPLVTSTPDQRRAVLVARSLLMRGSREEAIATELQSLLGASFVRIRRTTSSERLTWPAAPGDVGTDPPLGESGVYGVLLDAVPVPHAMGTVRTVRYMPLSDATPIAGQRLTIEPEVLGGDIAEAVTVLAAYDTRVGGVVTDKRGRITTAVAAAELGVPRYYRYRVEPGSAYIVAGDKLVVASSAGMEMVTVTAVQPTEPGSDPTMETVFSLAHPYGATWSSSSQITATFKRPHSAGAAITSAAPLWLSTQRELQVIVMASAARDPETQRRIHEIMARHCKSTSRWRIIETTDRLHTGPLVAGVGRAGVTASGHTAYPI